MPRTTSGPGKTVSSDDGAHFTCLLACQPRGHVHWQRGPFRYTKVSFLQLGLRSLAQGRTSQSVQRRYRARLRACCCILRLVYVIWDDISFTTHLNMHSQVGQAVVPVISPATTSTFAKLNRNASSTHAAAVYFS